MGSCRRLRWETFLREVTRGAVGRREESLQTNPWPLVGSHAWEERQEEKALYKGTFGQVADDNVDIVEQDGSIREGARAD